MKEKMLENINNPTVLEQLYRSDKKNFEKAFDEIYVLDPKHTTLEIWKARLQYNEASSSLYSKKELVWTLILILIAGIIANIGNLKAVDGELFYTRNTAFIIIPFLAIFFLLQQNAGKRIKIIVAVLFIISAIYINLLPNLRISSTIQLTYIHLPIFLWCVLGYAFVGEDNNNIKRIGFLKYNGDLLVMSILILLAGMLFTVITIGLFELIGMNIAQFYMQYIVIWGIAGVPILATYLMNTNPQIINKVTPIIAKIFTPLAFINLTIYLFTLMSRGKYPHHDRNLLLIYNALLVGVLALIFFSVAEIDKNKKGYYQSVLLLGLSVLTIVINAIALSAISFRIFEYGITPNRIAVLGSNLLVFANLIIVSVHIIKCIKNNAELTTVQESIAKYLPIYAIWVGLVAFIIPIIFNFK